MRIRFPGLNLAFNDENVLIGLASIIGPLIKVDMNTINGEHGKFARVYVEIDLSIPVVGKICIMGY